MTLLAGAAARDISPLEPMFLVGYPHVERVSTGVNDPLMASALCLSDGGRTLALVSVDILLINPPFARRLRREAAAAAGARESDVLINCTHTHSGPVTFDMLAWVDDPVVPKLDPAYMRRLEEGVVAAVAAARRNMRPAELAVTSAKVEGVGCNRHSPDGPRDPEAGIVAVRDAKSKELFAVATTYCMHPTVLHEDSTLVSADFPGYARMRLKEKLGPDLTALHLTGPEGDQSPRYHVKGQTFAEAERLGNLLADQILAALPGAAFKTEAVMGSALAEVALIPREMPSLAEAERTLAERVARFEELKRQNAGHGPIRGAECAVFGAEETVTMAKCQADGSLAKTVKEYTPLEVQALRLGDCYLAAFPGEIFVEYGLELKRRLAGRKVFPVCLVNGEMQGYVVTPEAAARGGYEASNATFAPESGELLVAALAKLVKSL